MDDLISRKAILKNIEKIRQGVLRMDDTHRASIIMNGMYLCEKAVSNQPSAQPEIIRCKDCKHRPFDSEDTQGFEFPDEKCPCQCEDFWYSWRPNDEWFCANAERRTDEH